MAAQWVGQFRHRVSMLAVAAQGVMNVNEHPTHIILDDFAASLGDLASSLKGLQEELEVSSHYPHYLLVSCGLRPISMKRKAGEDMHT